MWRRVILPTMKLIVQMTSIRVTSENRSAGRGRFASIIGSGSILHEEARHKARALRGMPRFCVVSRLDFGCGVINDPIRVWDCERWDPCLRLLKIWFELTVLRLLLGRCLLLCFATTGITFGFIRGIALIFLRLCLRIAWI